MWRAADIEDRVYEFDEAETFDLVAFLHDSWRESLVVAVFVVGVFIVAVVAMP